MNARTFADFRERFIHRARVVARHLDPLRRADVFSKGNEIDALQMVYVINLDRKLDRWRRIRRELDRFSERGGQRLSSITRRFSAIDARYLVGEPDPALLETTFTLAEQLAVHPNPLLEIDDETRARQIHMSKQERAVALSHIAVCKLVAKGDAPSVLILEDDVVLSPGFALRLRAVWSALVKTDGKYDFDLLYLAYRDVSISKPPRTSRPERRLIPGLWEASGYVLSKEGAQTLLAELPVRGPVDLWLNMKFDSLRVFTAPRQLIEQRMDEPSTNSYSVLPILSQVGAITLEKPLLPNSRKLTGPVVAFGPPDSGLTALAKGLSMLGYTCLNDVEVVPFGDLEKLLRGKRDTKFNAFVNIGAIDGETIRRLTLQNPRAHFISTKSDLSADLIPADRLLNIPPDTKDKWADLTDFLHLDYPSFSYPEDADLGQRIALEVEYGDVGAVTHDMKADTSPWILKTPKGSSGIKLSEITNELARPTTLSWHTSTPLDMAHWKLRDDTFPSNLALFTKDSAVKEPGGPMSLTLRKRSTSVRDFTSAAIASRKTFLYGSFSAELRPSNIPGLITGLFLHRNGPRQEIDIEFLGKDTTKMLVNVYFNPGPNGTKLEYGYRGTPTEIDLGFDASAEFHRYEINWQPNEITWLVDDKQVYQRRLWGPTPIPDQPLEFNINLWNSRSVEFAGRLDETRLPAISDLRAINILASEASALPTPVPYAVGDNA